jgi:hypothetical protein
MNKCLMAALATSAFVISAGTASAATLVLGDNSLVPQVHADPSMPSVGTTVYGLIKPSDVQVAFTSSSSMQITGGSGYAQIADANTGVTPFNNLAIQLATSPLGFTGIEFTIQYALASRTNPAYLSIIADLVGGGTQTFSFLSGDPVRDKLEFTNSGARDFRLAATGTEVFSKLTLSSNVAFDQIKQTDIQLATAPSVPEPATWAMMLAGFGLLGAGMRRSKTETRVRFAI